MGLLGCFTAIPLAMAENFAVGTVVLTVSASETDSPDTAHGQVLYSFVTGSDSANFYLEETSGDISLVSPLDYETDKAYVLTVKAADDSLSSTVIVSISVTDINDNGPVFNPTAYRYIGNQIFQIP